MNRTGGSGRRVCMLSCAQADDLRAGRPVPCRLHQHCTRAEARVLVMGGQHVEAHSGRMLETENYHPEARWATLPDGRESQQHIALTEAFSWRRSISGDVAVMQLISLGRLRTRRSALSFT